VRPPWQDTEEGQNQDDDQYCYKHVVLLVMYSLGIQPLSKLHRVHRYIEMLIAIPTLGYQRLKDCTAVLVIPIIFIVATPITADCVLTV